MNQGLGQGAGLKWVWDSISRRRLYLARRSDWRTEPTLIWSAAQPTARSASQSSSVSPLRALMVTFQPADLASFNDSAASVRVPIWLTLRRSASAAAVSTAR